ncbi:AraC family transcriptional regulator [Proteiniphilum sp.]|uniref:helix-turn-helix domain-containing protein n=1 Tax=Proteiniphilum sp. TaxID=1926877 RepID=UPI00332767DA
MDVNRCKRKNNESKYLLTDVESCTFTFSDGLKSKINTSPDNDIVLIKLIPRTSKLKWFEDRVLSNYMSAKTMKELAELCNYDCLKTFTRHFKRCFDETPYQWMLDRKMGEIQSLVHKSDFSITEISNMYGFKNVSHLVNVYTKKFGMSPQKDRIANAI